jgi:arsenite-transporting ATPase
LRLILFTGTGGAGTTTLAAAGAVHAARFGIKTLLLSLDGDGSLDDILAPDAAVGGALTCRTGSAPGVASAVVAEHLRALFDQLGVDPVPAELIGVLPGIDEVAALIEVREAVAGGPWDLVIVDLGPSGEALRLLALPEALTHYLERMLGVGRRVQRAMTLPADPLVAGADRLRGELAAVAEVLSAPSTSVRLVSGPRCVAQAHTRRTLTRLALQSARVEAVLINGAETGQAADAAAGWPVPVHRVPRLAAEPVGTEALAALGALLDDPATLLDPPRPDTAGGPFSVSRHGTEYELALALPLARREELDLHRLGDDLVIGLGRHRRVLTLPSGLRRCRVVGARLDDAVLLVRFEPDPALWRS